MIIAIIPAHNEGPSVGRTIASIQQQTRPPEQILVVSDNSTDDTVEVARAAGALVMETVDNSHRKAGALNQGLATLNLTADDLVLVMDADTELSPGFIDRCLAELRNPEVGAVGAVFGGMEPHGYLEYMQYMEWSRYAEQLDRTKKTFVLSGTAAVIRWNALQDVRRIFGRFYDENSITEDMRMTLDLKTAGWRLSSPLDCRSTTEMMPTTKLLFLQRRRWYLGALQNVTSYGFTKVSLPYWRQQLMLSLSVFLMFLYVSLTLISLVFGWFVINPFWLAIGGVFALERVVTIWPEGWKARIIAALVIPELVYAVILQVSFVAAVHQHLTGQIGSWHHIDPIEEKKHVLS